MAVPTAPTNKFETGAIQVSLAIRIFLLCAFSILLAVGAAVFFTWKQGQAIAREAVARSVRQSNELQKQSTERRFSELLLKTQLMAADPAFAEYVECASGQTLDLGGDCAPELSSTASIRDLLEERKENIGFDLGVVTDQAGKLLAQTDQVEALQRDLSNDAFFGPLVAEGGIAPAFLQYDGQLYHAHGIALQRRDEVVAGYLVLGLKIGDEAARQIANVSGSHIAYWLPTANSKGFVASSLDDAVETEVTKLLGTHPALKEAIEAGLSAKDFELNFAAQRWVTSVGPVEEGAPKELGAVLSMTSLNKATAGYEQLLNRVLIAGLGSLLLALPLSLLLSRPVLQPIRLMADAAEKAAAGDFNSRIGIGGKDALARLSQSFDTLLSSLREKNEMEGYVSSVSRLLPDAGDASLVARMEPTQAASPMPLAPEMANLHLLALEYRQLALPIAAGQLSKRAEEFEIIERRVNMLGRHCGAQVVHNSGNRFIAGFPGSHGLQDALGLLRGLLDAPEVLDSLGAHAPAAALVQGDVMLTSGAPEFPSGPVILGTAAFQCDRLLAESAPGLVILGRPALDWLKTHHDIEPVMHKGATSARQFFALDRNALNRLPAPVLASEQMTDHANATTVNVAAVPVTQREPVRSKPAMDLMPGERFGGRYQILSVLGSGGMGVVYKARDQDLDDIVALKMLRTHMGIDHESLERLKSELKLARKISHPNVLKTFDFGLIDGRPFLSMEYVRGMTLRYLLEQPERVPFTAALRLARQICAGLVAAHDEGVLHRDIKPENVIIEPGGNAKLMDFGIARPIRRVEPGQTQAGMFVGTPRYAAPEQLAGEEVDARADVYAMGVLLCELFCGGFPYGGSNTMEIYLAQMQQEPVRPSQLWAQVPTELEQLILKAIAKDRVARFQSARDLQSSLNGIRA